MTLDVSKILSIYPQGDYRSHWWVLNWYLFNKIVINIISSFRTISDDQDDKIFSYRVYASVKSSIKSSFWFWSFWSLSYNLLVTLKNQVDLKLCTWISNYAELSLLYGNLYFNV